MRKLAGPGSRVHFTHLSQSSCNTLSSVLNQEINDDDFALASPYQESAVELMGASDVPLEKVCLLDPKAEKQLSPEDGDGRFSWFLFGVGFFVFTW